MARTLDSEGVCTRCGAPDVHCHCPDQHADTEASDGVVLSERLVALAERIHLEWERMTYPGLEEVETRSIDATNHVYFAAGASMDFALAAAQVALAVSSEGEE